MTNTFLSLMTFASLFSANALAANPAWVFTSSVPTKSEMLSIPRNANCRPLNTQLMNANCVQYKLGYVCPQEDKSQFIISTYANKSECNKALKKARRVLARQ